jgi:hypothetical protein
VKTKHIPNFKTSAENVADTGGNNFEKVGKNLSKVALATNFDVV